MRVVMLPAILSLLVLCGWGSPPQALALDFADSRHLLLRAGFGPDAHWVAVLASLNREQAVDTLLKTPSEPLSFPACAQERGVPFSVLREWSQEQRSAYRKQQRACGAVLKGWYLQRLVDSHSPLHERLALFWHNHFTSSLRKVVDPALMADQHRLLFDHAAGNFAELLQAVIHDPAMLRYLDNINNRKAKPNENLARELLELFTLGEGNYNESDIREAARALTGLSIDPATGQTRFFPARHDAGEKTLFGKKGRFDASQLLEQILQQQAAADFITRKLWLHFVSEPDDRQIRELSRRFHEDWDIAELVRSILLSEPFWRDQGRMIKSPVALLVGNRRLLDLTSGNPKAETRELRRLGQDLFDPPNVKGWAVDEWIAPDPMLVRVGLSERLVRGYSDEAEPAQLDFICRQHSPELFSALAPLVDISRDEDCQQRLEKVVSDPAWQLK